MLLTRKWSDHGRRQDRHHGHGGTSDGDWEQLLHGQLIGKCGDGRRRCDLLMWFRIISSPPKIAFLTWNGQTIIHQNLAYLYLGYPALKIEYCDTPTYLLSLNLCQIFQKTYPRYGIRGISAVWSVLVRCDVMLSCVCVTKFARRPLKMQATTVLVRRIFAKTKCVLSKMASLWPPLSVRRFTSATDGRLKQLRYAMIDAIMKRNRSDTTFLAVILIHKDGKICHFAYFGFQFKCSISPFLRRDEANNQLVLIYIKYCCWKYDEGMHLWVQNDMCAIFIKIAPIDSEKSRKSYDWLLNPL